MARNDKDNPATRRSVALRVTELSRSDTVGSAMEPVTFEVAAGEMVTVVAPERAAVASLLHLLSGVALPDTGTIELDGLDVTTEPAYQRVRRGLARSYPLRALWAGMTVEDHLRMAVQSARESACRPWRRDPAHEAATDRLLARAGLADRAAITPCHLTAGERRRLEVAIVLADDPGLALLDEPLTGVSGHEAEELAALVQSLRDEDGRTVLMTAPPESVDRLQSLSDRVVVLQRQPAGDREAASGGVAESATGLRASAGESSS